MPLPPSGNTPWPPPQLEIPHADMDMWRAWYAGDTGHLAQVYGGRPVTPGTGWPASSSK